MLQYLLVWLQFLPVRKLSGVQYTRLIEQGLVMMQFYSHTHLGPRLSLYTSWNETRMFGNETGNDAVLFPHPSGTET